MTGQPAEAASQPIGATNDSDADILRRHFVAVATSNYDDPLWERLGVDGEVRAMADWLCADGLGARRFTHAHPHLAHDPTEDDIRKALRNPPHSERWGEADAAVVFVTGHGTIGDGGHWTALKATESNRLQATALRTADLVGWLSETDVQHLFLVLDLCYAGRTVAETAVFDREIPGTWLVLPSATRNQEAVTGALTTAIAGFLAELASPIGQKYGLDRHLDVTVFLDAVERRLGPGQRLIPLPGSRRSGPHPCLPNPHYRETSSVPLELARSDLGITRQDLDTHWGPRSRGVTEAASPGWLFKGRDRIMRRLVDATTAAPGAVLVTGSAGSGKSAVLARLVTLSDPVFLDRYRAEAAAVSSALAPRPRAVDAAVLATGKIGQEVIAQIFRALGVPEPGGSAESHGSPGPALDLNGWMSAWRSWLERRERPVTIVVDALDEASDPVGLLTGVLARLDPGDPTHRKVRLFVGVRSSGGPDGADSGPVRGGGGPSLADRAERLLSACRIRVDERPWWEPQDMVDYATEILLREEGSPYRDHDMGLAVEVASVLAAQAGTSFLVARIAGTSLTRRSDVVNPDDPQWRNAIGEGVLGVFRHDLHRTLPEGDDRVRAVHLLRAVAFSYGRGLPWPQIWPAVANAVADEPGTAGTPPRTYGDSDIAWLLGSRLGAYLVTDREDGATVYRLFHDALRSTLRTRWRELLE
ncbi:AAA family ATPase [Streptomyces sp. NPDC058202]|uniref:AAA family ATPase n=1 Tax=Streptomyces sp. NPDC058202 TaxID=3346380 RepID=UPI0036E92974